MTKKFLPRKKDNYPAEKGYYNPFMELQRQMNDLFGSFFDDTPSMFSGRGISGDFAPKFDISETDKAIEINAELPGMEEKDIDISIENNILCIKGEKRSEEKKDEKNYHLTERSYGSFQRRFTLPEGVDLNKVKAKFNNGVLNMEMPKTAESRKKITKIKISK
jgi:HSP20 family protein